MENNNSQEKSSSTLNGSKSSSNANILEKIRDSCGWVVKNAKSVKIDTDKIDKFLDELDIENFKKKSAPFGFPLKFDSIEEEINFIALLDILNFGSGYRKFLHKINERGAYETITFGLFGIQINGKKVDSTLLSQMSLFDVSTFFGLPLSVEVELQPAIKQLVPSEVRPLAVQIHSVIQQTGKILKQNNAENFGDFIIDQMTKNSKRSAAELVQILVSTFPAFADKALYRDQEVFIIKKAQLLVADLHRRFGPKDERFRFEDIGQLTVFSDNVLPAVLRKLNILQLEESLAKQIDAGEILPPGDAEIELRTAAIVACEEIVKRAKAKHKDSAELQELFTPMQLDYYLWTLGKEGDFRKFERHYTTDTIYY